MNRFLRLHQIIGDESKGIEPIIPVSKSVWWAGVKSGEFPEPYRLGDRVTVWKSSEIQDFVNNTTQRRGA